MIIKCTYCNKYFYCNARCIYGKLFINKYKCEYKIGTCTCFDHYDNMHVSWKDFKKKGCSIRELTDKEKVALLL